MFRGILRYGKMIHVAWKKACDFVPDYVLALIIHNGTGRLIGQQRAALKTHVNTTNFEARTCRYHCINLTCPTDTGVFGQFGEIPRTQEALFDIMAET